MAERVMIPAIVWAGGIMVPLPSDEESCPWRMADEEGCVYFAARHPLDWADGAAYDGDDDLAAAYRLLGDLIDELEAK